MAYEIVLIPQVTSKVGPSYSNPRWRYEIHTLKEDGSRDRDANWKSGGRTSKAKGGVGWTRFIAMMKARWFRIGLNHRASVKKKSELRVERHKAQTGVPK